MATIIVMIFNWVGAGASFSVFGQRLELDRRPMMLRMRWLGVGMVLALALTDYQFADDGWVGWTSVLLLAVGSSRRRLPPPIYRLPPLAEPVFPPTA